MKKDLHPKDYRTVVFEDLNNGFKVLTKSTIKTTDVTVWEDGLEYPLVKVHISSASHPFYTGDEKLLDIEGRVDKFKARQEAAAKAKAVKTTKNKVTKPKQEEKSKEESTEKLAA